MDCSRVGKHQDARRSSQSRSLSSEARIWCAVSIRAGRSAAQRTRNNDANGILGVHRAPADCTNEMRSGFALDGLGVVADLFATPVSRSLIRSGVFHGDLVVLVHNPYPAHSRLLLSLPL